MESEEEKERLEAILKRRRGVPTAKENPIVRLLKWLWAFLLWLLTLLSDFFQSLYDPNLTDDHNNGNGSNNNNRRRAGGNVKYFKGCGPTS